MKRLIQLEKLTSPFILALLLAYFGLVARTQAVVPAPDGGYPGGNTAEGQAALLSLTAGGFNTAVGFLSLRSNTTNSFNTAIGAGALLANTADSNTATGAGALLSNTTGSVNTAYGAFALFHNTTGGGHTAVGYNALAATNASDFLEGNTAVGSSALANDTDGNANTAIGFAALLSNTTGNSNTATGVGALASNTTGSSNTALGAGAGSLQTGSNNIFIGDTGQPGESNIIAIGNLPSSGTPYAQFFVGGVYGVTTGHFTTLPVIVDQFGQLGTAPSAARFNKEIKPMAKASESVLALKPVTFQYKSDKSNTPQFGLVAEDVEKVNRDLVVRDKEGKPYLTAYVTNK
jgi:hypothetical protein